MDTLHFLFVILLISVLGVHSKQDNVLCSDVLKRYKERGFLTNEERASYCFGGCGFLDVNCNANKQGEAAALRYLADAGSIAFKRMDIFLTDFSEADFDNAHSQGDGLDAIIVSTIYDVIYRTWSAPLALIPILLNQWKHQHFVISTLLLTGFVILSMLGLSPPAIGAHNCLVTLLCLIHPANSTYLIESTWTVIGILCLSFVTFIPDFFTQIGILFVSIAGYFGYLYWIFFTKRAGANAAVFVVISQMFVLMEQLTHIRTMYANDMLGAMALQMSLNTVLPVGTSRYFMVNVIKLAAKITLKLDMLMYKPIAFAFLYVLQVVMFLGFRASIGGYYLYVLRYRFDATSLQSGFLVYVIDWYGPYRCLFRLCFRYERMNMRRLFYALVGIVLGYYEWCAAYEFALLRIAVSTVDSIFTQSLYGRTTHYLEFQVDFLQSAYPHPGALPWVSLSELHEISRFCGYLYANKAGRTVRGIGVALCSGGSNMLYCVSHVVKDATLIKFQDIVVGCPDFRKLTKADDPMVAMKIKGLPEEPPAVELLTRDEAFLVKNLVFINANDKERFLCVVPHWKLSGAKLHASVNLKKGDSGGPCFAVLQSGELRLCGVVSSGNPRAGGGNIIAFCYHDGEPGANSSDDDSLGSVAQFNRIRRDSKIHDGAATLKEFTWRVNKFLKENCDDIHSMRDWPIHFTWDDMDEKEDIVIDRMMKMEDDTESKRDEHGADDGHGDDNQEGNKPKKKGRAKSNYKERAARKRNFYYRMKELRTLLMFTHTANDAKTIFNAVMKGNTPEVDDHAHVQYYEYTNAGGKHSWYTVIDDDGDI